MRARFAHAIEEPQVGTAYALTHGSVAILRYEGRKLEQKSEHEGCNLAVRMTGDGRLYEATTQVLDRSQTCEGAIAEMTQQFAAPDIDQRPSYALWRDRRRSGSPYARSRVAPNCRSGQSR